VVRHGIAAFGQIDGVAEGGTRAGDVVHSELDTVVSAWKGCQTRVFEEVESLVGWQGFTFSASDPASKSDVVRGTDGGARNLETIDIDTMHGASVFEIDGAIRTIWGGKGSVRS
jgi:hypothetical protein